MERIDSQQRRRGLGSQSAMERRLADLTRLSPDAILVNRDDRIEFANQAAAELFGVATPDELVGHSPLRWFHPADHALVRERIRLTLGGETLRHRSTLTVVRSDGTTRVVEGLSARFEDERGPALQVVLHDVSDRVRYERELGEANTRLAELVESVTDGFYAVDASWRVTYVNRRAGSAWGRSREQVLGTVLWELFPGQAATEGSLALRRAMADRQPAHFETYSPFLQRWVETSAYPSAGGGLAVFFRDLTERHQLDVQLRRLAESLPQLVWTADAAGRLDWFNQRWRDYTGQAPGAEAWEPCLHPDDRQGVLALWRAAVERGSDFELEHRLRGAGGEFRWFLRRAYPFRGPDGQPTRWFGTCTDIHDLKRSQEALRQADKLKEDFLNMASHEFRTPLTALRLQVELLRRNLRSPDPARKRAEHQLQVVDAQIDRLQVLLGTLLDVSHINAGRFTLDLADLDLAELAAEVVERCMPEAVSCATPLRVTGEPVTGCWDRARLDQVVTNLVGNAIKYGDRRPVVVEVEASGDLAVLRVRDQGIGIAPESLQRIFDRFERAAGTPAIKGLGLGLWIARTMVEAHGGELTVESRPGEGATFTVTLPRGLR